jgi:hypothetical protein
MRRGHRLRKREGRGPTPAVAARRRVVAGVRRGGRVRHSPARRRAGRRRGLRRPLRSPPIHRGGLLATGGVSVRVSRGWVDLPDGQGLLLGSLRARLLPWLRHLRGSGRPVQHADGLLQRALRAKHAHGGSRVRAVLHGRRFALPRGERLLFDWLQRRHVRRTDLRGGGDPVHRRRRVLLGPMRRPKRLRPNHGYLPAQRRGVRCRQRDEMLFRHVQHEDGTMRSRTGCLPRTLDSVHHAARLLSRRLHAQPARPTRGNRLRERLRRGRARLQLERRLLRADVHRIAHAVRNAAAGLPIGLPFGE